MPDNVEQKLSLFNREKLELEGVLEVIDFDENKVRLETDLGNLIIEGTDLKMKHLDLDSKEISIAGYVEEIKYDKVFKANSFFKRLFK